MHNFLRLIFLYIIATELDNLVQCYFEQGLSMSTHKTCKTDINEF